MAEDFFHRLGPLAVPLLLCSVVALALIVERAVFFLRLRGGAPKGLRHRLHGLTPPQVVEVLTTLTARRSGPFFSGLGLLLAHRDQPRSRRDEVVSLWLREHAGQVQAGLRWLTLIAVISPLLGLFGTVLGMIVAFQDISAHQGPVHPALLAGGIWQAMLTTAAGLAIALPALVAAHGFRSLGLRHLDRLGLGLSAVSLALDGGFPHQGHGKALERAA